MVLANQSAILSPEQESVGLAIGTIKQCHERGFSDRRQKIDDRKFRSCQARDFPESDIFGDFSDRAFFPTFISSRFVFFLASVSLVATAVRLSCARAATVFLQR
jgi:hypothetical protein